MMCKYFFRFSYFNQYTENLCVLSGN